MLLAFSQAVAGAAELKSTRWEKEIAAFEASDRKKSPPKGAILFVGSSSIRYWTNLAADFPELKVINRGFGGSHVADTTYFADRIIFPYEPSKIVVYAGDNDIGRGASPEQVLKKRFGIFIHQSQKDSVPFQGTDAREFWQRAEERNANTAELYARLGLTKYAAMEAFVRWHY